MAARKQNLLSLKSGYTIHIHQGSYQVSFQSPLQYLVFFLNNQRKYLILRETERLQREDANLYLMPLVLRNKYKEVVENLTLFLDFQMIQSSSWFKVITARRPGN